MTNDGMHVWLSDEDLVRVSPRQALSNLALGGSVGYLSFTTSWLALVTAFPSLLQLPLSSYSLLAAVALGTSAFAILGGKRNWIVRRIANHGFVATYWSQRALSWLFWIGTVLALYGLFATRGIIPNYSPPLSLFLTGLFFLLAFPRIGVTPLMTRLREGRLCMLQFISDWNSGSPELQTGHRWLKKSLSAAEQQINAFGLAIPNGMLFLGSSYSIFKGTISSEELEQIGDWVIRPGDWFRVNWTITFLLSQASKAEEAGFGKLLGFWESLLKTPSRKLKLTAGIILGASTVLGTIPTIVQAVSQLLNFVSK